MKILIIISMLFNCFVVMQNLEVKMENELLKKETKYSIFLILDIHRKYMRVFESSAKYDVAVNNVKSFLETTKTNKKRR